MENPWKTLSSREVYTNPWITVREDQVTRPDGKPGIYSVVSARHAVAVIAINDRGEIAMVGQYRYPTECYSWEIVEGGSEPGHAPLETARIELREETGLEADEWIELPGELHFSNSFSAERGSVFIARKLTQREAQPEGTEVLTFAWWPLENLLDAIDEGTIVDGFTVYSVLRAERLGLLR